MNRRMLTNDFKKNRLITIATCAFMAASACFIGLTLLLSANLLTSIDDLMERARTCDFLQMHTGEIDEAALERFAEDRNEVEEMQICRMLNMENGTLSLNGKSMADNNQDNGLCVQSGGFDYLLGMDSERIEAGPGQVYVPVCYRDEYDLKRGQFMEIGGHRLTIAGFLRDSQMNSMMASSKRFLVSPEDYAKFRSEGSEEYLIEFLLKEGSDSNAFAKAYAKAGLPGNGPTITAPLIRMMNALSDGLMILVILLAGVLVLIISLICIRCIVLTGMEKDRREMGMLKAIGISAKDMRRIYLSKYLLLSVTGGVAGLALAAILAGPLGRQMRDLYGASGELAWPAFAAVAGVAVTEAVLLWSVRRNLKKSERIPAVEALRGTNRRGGRSRRRFVLIAGVLAACVILMLVPLNLSSTISSDRFVTYMGIGGSQIRMDVRQSENINGITEQLMKELGGDARVKEFAVMQTKRFGAVLENGSQVDLLVELGDHNIFPLSYSRGTAPGKPGEIALSNLNAEELGCDLGDTIVLERNGAKESYVVCGIYSDITNGGKTAKAYGDPSAILQETRDPVMWSVVYVTLQDGQPVGAWMEEYRGRYSGENPGGSGNSENLGVGGAVKIVDIGQYLEGTYGPTIQRIRRASRVSILAACGIIFIVVLLFLRLAIWQERSDSSLKKALGISDGYIRREYMKKALICFAAGTAAGVLLAITAGQRLAGLLLSLLGASGFHFIIDVRMALILIPAAALAVAMLAARVSLREIRKIRAYECCAGRE